MEVFAAYIPTDRRHALARTLGPRRGAEELTIHLNWVYQALIQEVDRYGASVIAFAGDAITCWFEGDDGWRAVTCALSMQATMAQFSHMKQYVTWVQRVMARYDGFLVDVAMGDKGNYLYGCFGAPIAHENDAWPAAAAAPRGPTGRSLALEQAIPLALSPGSGD